LITANRLNQPRSQSGLQGLAGGQDEVTFTAIGQPPHITTPPHAMSLREAVRLTTSVAVTVTVGAFISVMAIKIV